ncbi:hypothetical protein BGZ97_000586 [Linnemannia gamsii]|uniref:Uncharacterized protein n=1 Tax=Linnemannia gamsii TaxID=64522 RepID=A0A9P6QXZ4_9FUNG|nr:hypothetical protein BGZ97_000586 [Linnemannia gamsii]
MARISFFLSIIAVVAVTITSSVSAMPVDPADPAVQAYGGAWCYCDMPGWSAHCGKCSDDESNRGCKNQWSSKCS